MKRTTRSFEIADPFYAALETMSREMSVDQDTLVNQALFSFARLNGFIVPTVVSLEADSERPAPPPFAATAPRRTATSAPLAVTPVAQIPEAAPTAPEALPNDALENEPRVEVPAASVAPPSVVESIKPTVDLAARRAIELDRMEKIAHDVDAWVVPVEPPIQPQADDDHDAAVEDDGGDEAPQPQEVPPTDDEPGSAAVDDDLAHTQAERDEAPAHALGATTVSRQVIEPRPENTVLVRPSSSVKVWVQADQGGEVEVEPGRFVIGRGDNCNLIIDSLRVSREHASIQIVGREVIIEDLGSSNGTWYDGEKIERRLVANGDELMVGNERVRFRIEA